MSDMMVDYDIFGAKGVKIEIPKAVFPTKEELDLMDQTVPGSQHGWFESSYKKRRLHYCCWVPEGEVKGVVVFCHGISSYCWKGTVIDDQKLSTSLMVDSFLRKGVAVYSFDYLGHGFSEGTRFFIPDWQNNKQDIVNFCNLAASKHPTTVPFFLGGESYGGCLAIHVARYFQDKPEAGPSNFDSILLVAPAIIGDLPPFPVYQILRYGLAPLFPKWIPFFMPNPISPDRIWRNEKVLKQRTSHRYREMGIDGGGLPFRLGTALNLVVALEEVRKEAVPGLNVPFCAVHGTADYGVPIEGSMYLVEHCATPDNKREFHELQGAYHDIFCDPLAEEAMGRWLDFVQKRIDSKA
jgi:acylglycerol lipase